MSARPYHLVPQHLSRPFIAGWFSLFRRHRHRRLVIEEVCGIPLVVLPEVFNPALFRSSELLVQAVQEAEPWADLRVLDMGSGSGLCGLAAASRGGTVTAVDISPAARRCTRINAILNGIEERIDIRGGDLFSSLPGARFDLVLFNPPFFIGEPEEEWQYAWRSADVIPRFLRDVWEHLSPGGRVLIVLSSEAPGAWKCIADSRLDARTLRYRQYVNETLSVLELRSLS